MIWILTVLITALALYAFGFWSTRIYPKPRPYRFNQTSDVQLPEARQTMLHNTLATRNGLKPIVASALSDAESVDAIMHWVHQLWTPLPGRQSSSQNPQTIISRAQNGERFSRSDYATVLAHALMAVNIPARLVTLNTRDCTWRPMGSQYRGVEYFDRDHFKWVWFDASWGVRVVADYRPLNAFQIKEAVLDNQLVTLAPDIHAVNTDDYLDGIMPFLDIIVSQPMGQSLEYALIPPQLNVPRRKWWFGRRQYDISCHSPQAYYASHPIKTLTTPDKTQAIHIRTGRKPVRPSRA